MMWVFLAICFLSMPLAWEMARERGRSQKLWLWVAFLAGPLAPIVLLLLGDAGKPVSAR
jgi:hypothetical protein